ncbi:MAG: response regulator [Candidatus Fermentibacteraceae bacterium]|nr:response regulator [Candidatus Fermentibacteraceae bacterium]
MSGKSKFAGGERLYAPFILAFFVFSVVIGAEYLIVQWLIEQSNKQEIAEYHDAIREIIDNINRYEMETGASVYRDSIGTAGFILPSGMDNAIIRVIGDEDEYRTYIQARINRGLSVESLGYSDTIIETSTGKTDNGEIVVLESYEYINETTKNLRKLSSSLIIILIIMIIIAVVPGSLLIESRTRRLSMLSYLSPSSEESDSSALHRGIQSSNAVAFMVVLPDGEVVSMNPSCEKLLETGESYRDTSIASLTVLPADVRGENLALLKGMAVKNITLQLMDGSRKNCVMEMHPFYKDDTVAAVLLLLIRVDGVNQLMGAGAISAATAADNSESEVKIHLVKSLIHDMNNHISGIIGVASIELETSDADGSFDSVLDSAEKLADLCNDLQTTITGGAERRLGNLSHEIGLIAEILRKILPERVEIEVTGSCRAWIKADLELLREFFYGLALNSMAIMNGEGRIRVDVSNRVPVYGNTVDAVSPGYKVCIRYSDGYIMPVALRDILSNRNYSVADVERQYGATVGNGYKALNKLDGSVVFERGSGETVLCLLLDGYEHANGEEEVYDRIVRNPDAPGLSILVADDVDIVLRSVSDYLEKNGMTVTKVTDGDSAMELLRQYSYDAAVLDLNMPGTPTLGIVRYCQTSKPDMAIVITSGFDTPHGVRDLIVAASTGYLHKPHKPEALLEMIYSLVHRMEERN